MRGVTCSRCASHVTATKQDMKTCDNCGVELDPRRKRWCSNQCRIDYRNAQRKIARRQVSGPIQTDRQCAICGAGFQAQYKTRNKKYCSPKCKQKAKREKRKNRLARQLKTCVDCGEELQHGEFGKLCKACRSKRYKAAYKNSDAFVKWCTWCGDTFETKSNHAKYCTKACALERHRHRNWLHNSSLKNAVYKCQECGVEFEPAYGNRRRVYCSWACKRRVINRQSGDKSHQGRAKHYGVKYKWFNERAILRRDGWRCYICGRPTPKAKRGTYDDDAPELDHIVPLSRGGAHVRSNVACSCRQCNGDKGNQTLEEYKQYTQARG